MTDRTLSYVLRDIKLEECVYLENGIFYSRRIVAERKYSFETELEHPGYLECEFLVITEQNIKKAIIYNCNNEDLHWYVFTKWRGKHILSNALRTGIIREVWPDIESVTYCCYSWEDKQAKLAMTEHLASLAGLTLREGRTCWISRSVIAE